METTNLKCSVVIVIHDEGEVLEQHLPLFLDVASEVGAEVIVVDDSSTDTTPDVLKRMKAEHQNLYCTFLPRSVVMNPSRLRLAQTVGAKAAKADCVVLADIHRPPVSADWLSGLCDGEAALVYSNRRGEVTHVVATELEDLRPTIVKAERQSGRGHRGKWLKRRRGLYDAMSVKKERVYDAIKYFDLPVRGRKLMGLRLRVWL